MKLDVDVRAMTSQRLVDGVVDDLPQAVDQAARVGGPDVHARALADGLQTLQDQQVPGVVGVRLELAVAAGVERLGHLPRLPAARDTHPTVPGATRRDPPVTVPAFVRAV